jgi:signal transduction histidine kinase
MIKKMWYQWRELHTHPKLVQNYRLSLTVGFALLFAMAIVGGTLIIFFSARIEDDIQRVQTNYIQGIRIFGQIETNINLLRVFIRDEVYSTSPKSQHRAQRQIDSVGETVSRYLSEYEPYLNLPLQRENYQEYVTTFARYKSTLGEVYQTAHSGNRSLAISMLTEKLGPIRYRLDELSRKLFTESEQIATTIDRDVDALQDRFFLISITVLGSSVLVGGFIYLFIVRSFRTYIEGIASAQRDKENLLGLLTERQRRIEELILDLETSVEEQRKRFAQELHDAIGHGLTTTIFNIESALSGSQSTPEASAKQLQNALRSIREVLAETKRISYELRPPILDDFGLDRALQQLATDFENTTGISVQTDFDSNGRRLNPRAEISLYRIVQEALTNIEKHAGAHHVTLQSVFRDDGTIALSISDDGRGFDAQKLQQNGDRHLGLKHITERIELIGGSVIIDSVSGRGTEINIEVPTMENAKPHD